MKPSTRKALHLLLSVDGAWVSGNRLFRVAGNRYSARVFELRHEHGYDVQRRSAPNGNNTDEYRIPAEPVQQSMELAS